MANYLILNQNQVFNGLGTLTFTVPTTGQYNAQVQVTMPAGPAANSGVTGNSPGIGANNPVGNTVLGGGSGAGLGAGVGGGGTGFVSGDRGTGQGGVGQGFGATNNYQQPPSAGSNVTAKSATTSSLVVLVKNNGATIYTATTPALVQGALQFKTGFLATLGDSITVVLSSVASSDNQLSGVTSNVSISQGLL